MATTWQGRLTTWLPTSFKASAADDLPYRFERNEGQFTYSLEFPHRPQLNLPIETLVGGRRHGLGFLISMRDMDGLPLARPALIQARYAWSPEQNKLLLAPGCTSEKPQSVEAALGMTLSPTFQSRCLSCHGQPTTETGKQGGVRCESCHGPGSAHLMALGRMDGTANIVNPKRMSTEDSIGVCARCHVGLTRFADPSDDDLLIANQVRAIKSSECFLQSRKAFSCVACHDPHKDATDDQLAIKTCLGCHGWGSKLRAAICPVNAASGCTGCHMPAVDIGPLHLVDHLIRVHPEQKVQVVEHSPDRRTQVRPVSAFLRMIATDTEGAAATARERLRGGEVFYTVARETSMDSTASIGGYLGRKTLTELGKGLPEAAAELGYDEVSQIIHSGGRWVILQRLPRDFRWNAEQLQRQAEDLSARGDIVSAIEGSQRALMIYPQFLRAIDFIGTTFAKSGNPKKGADVLGVASRLYPDDAGTKFALASVLNMLNDQAGAKENYQKVISLESDFTAAYVNLGMTLYAAGELQGAIQIFRQGLQVDPLSAELYYDLSLALQRTGDTARAKEAMALAGKLQPSPYLTSDR